MKQTLLKYLKDLKITLESNSKLDCRKFTKRGKLKITPNVVNGVLQDITFSCIKTVKFTGAQLEYLMETLPLWSVSCKINKMI